MYKSYKNIINFSKIGRDIYLIGKSFLKLYKQGNNDQYLSSPKQFLDLDMFLLERRAEEEFCWKGGLGKKSIETFLS